jgi:hypothetical protein
MSLNKNAIDNAAKDYWSKYYGEYGKSWVREIPRKIKTAMSQINKQASDDMVIKPLVSIIEDTGLVLEGICKTSDSMFSFMAEFDNTGKVVDFDIANLNKSKSKGEKSRGEKSKGEKSRGEKSKSKGEKSKSKGEKSKSKGEKSKSKGEKSKSKGEKSKSK